jgi:large subunit ribosomal protein L32
MVPVIKRTSGTGTEASVAEHRILPDGSAAQLEFSREPEQPRITSQPKPLGESIMAVQQNKKSPSKRGMHRSHNALVTPGTAIEPTTGEVHLRHHISPNGFYRGRKVLKTKGDAA